MGQLDRDWYKDHHTKQKPNSNYQTLDKDPRELESPRKPFTLSILDIVGIFLIILFFSLGIKNFFF